MRIMAARDVHVHEPALSQAPTQAASTEPQRSIVAKALPYVAAALLTGGGLGAAVPWALGMYDQQEAEQPAQATEYVDTTTSIGISGGEPTLEW